MKFRYLSFHIISCIVICIAGILFSCRSHEINKCSYKVLAILAHPDDETLICGTLAKFIDKGCNVHVVFTTSGDDGPDKTGRELWGEPLAREREKEAQKSLRYIGVSNPPIFLKYPDSHVLENSPGIKNTLQHIYAQIKPDIVITFGPDGVTSDLDHITTGAIIDQIFDTTETGKLLLHIAISKKASYIYPIPAPFPDHLIDLRVNVKAFKRNRFKSNNAHRTQFGFGQRFFWRMFVRLYPFEEFVISKKRDGGDKLLKDCFL